MATATSSIPRGFRILRNAAILVFVFVAVAFGITLIVLAQPQVAARTIVCAFIETAILVGAALLVRRLSRKAYPVTPRQSISSLVLLGVVLACPLTVQVLFFSNRMPEWLPAVAPLITLLAAAGMFERTWRFNWWQYAAVPVAVAISLWPLMYPVLLSVRTMTLISARTQVFGSQFGQYAKLVTSPASDPRTTKQDGTWNGQDRSLLTLQVSEDRSTTSGDYRLRDGYVLELSHAEMWLPSRFLAENTSDVPNNRNHGTDRT